MSVPVWGKNKCGQFIFGFEKDNSQCSMFKQSPCWAARAPVDTAVVWCWTESENPPSRPPPQQHREGWNIERETGTEEERVEREEASTDGRPSWWKMAAVFAADYQRTALEKTGGSVCDSTQQNRKAHAEVKPAGPTSAFWVGRARQVQLLPFVSFIVPLCLLSFFRVCATLVLVASSLSSKPKHIIWCDQWICVPWPDHWRPPTDSTLKLIWIFFFLPFFPLSRQQMSVPSPLRTWLRMCNYTDVPPRETWVSYFPTNIFLLSKKSFLSPASLNIHKINSSLQIAQSSVPNPLQSLLVMIYSTRTKQSSRTPEYIFWQVLWFHLQKILQRQRVRFFILFFFPQNGLIHHILTLLRELWVFFGIFPSLRKGRCAYGPSWFVVILGQLFDGLPMENMKDLYCVHRE